MSDLFHMIIALFLFLSASALLEQETECIMVKTSVLQEQFEDEVMYENDVYSYRQDAINLTEQEEQIYGDIWTIYRGDCGCNDELYLAENPYTWRNNPPI